jgi:hypothetical protein
MKSRLFVNFLAIVPPISCRHRAWRPSAEDRSFFHSAIGILDFLQHFSFLKWPQAKVMGVSLKTENEE